MELRTLLAHLLLQQAKWLVEVSRMLVPDSGLPTAASRTPALGTLPEECPHTGWTRITDNSWRCATCRAYGQMTAGVLRPVTYGGHYSNGTPTGRST